MNGDRRNPLSIDELCRRAEARTTARPKRTQNVESDGDAHLLHRIEVLQTALQMQNDELCRTHVELEANRDVHCALSEVASIGTVTLDRDASILEINEAGARLLGLNCRASIGQALSSFLEPKYADDLDLHLHGVFEGNPKSSCELAFGSDEPATLRLDSFPVFDAEGRVHHSRTFLTDVGAWCRAEERIAAEKRRHTLLDTVSDAIIGIDSSGTVESFNRAAQETFGYRPSEIIGKSARMLLPEQFLDESTDLASLVHQPGARSHGRRKDGTAIPIEMRVCEWWDSPQRKFKIAIRDLSKRDEAERALFESEARFRQIAENVGDAFLVRERESHKVLYTNPAFEAIWQRPIHALEDNPSAWLDWVHPEDRERIAQGYASALRGVPFDDEYRICRPNGEIRWVRARMFPVESGRATHRDVVVIQDITTRRELDEQLQQLQKMDAIGALASGVAHDFNNVLQGVLGCLNVAREARTSPANSKQFLAHAEEAIKRGSALAERLVAFTRKRATNPEPIAIDTVILSLGILIERLVTEQVTVEFELAAAGAAILADEIQVEQILINLVGNARDAMPEGGSLVIETDVLQASDPRLYRPGLNAARRHVRLVVKDSGIGMDEQTRNRIFEPFFTTKETQGTGLGLATVFAITRQLYGVADVDSTIGLGSSFTVILPCVDEKVLLESLAETHHSQISFRGTALLVEDDPMVRLTVGVYLENLGFEVLAAKDVTEIEDLCRHREALDLLVSDVILPILPGRVLAAQLCERYPGIRVLFVSANPWPETETLGSASFLRKPFTPEELAERLQALLCDRSSQEG